MNALVLDLMPLRDSPNEGELIQACMRNIGWRVKLVSKATKSEAIREILEGGRLDIIHISAHGFSDGISVRSGRLTVSELRRAAKLGRSQNARRHRKIRLFVNSSCQSYSRDWLSLAREIGARRYLAPRKEPTIGESILVTTAVYLGLWGQHRNLRITEAFQKSKKQLRALQGDWRMR